MSLNRHDLHSQIASVKSQVVSVNRQLELLLDLVGLQEPAAGTTSPSERSEYFDDKNAAHLAEAHRLFDVHGLDDYRRSWYLNRRLQGEKMIDIADVIDKEVRAYNPRRTSRTRSEPSARSRGRGY